MKKKKTEKTVFHRFYGILKLWVVVWLIVLTHLQTWYKFKGEKRCQLKNQLQREFKGSNFEIREKLITDTYFTSFLEYVSSPESISKIN